MNYQYIIDEYNEYRNQNKWKEVFMNAKFDSETIDYTYTHARYPFNVKYNRYRDILPYDHTRIVLRNCDTTDYINANIVECSLAKRRYILTQGPLRNTCEHFWQMIWEQNARGIIMLNKIIEKGAVKCEVYYPNTDEDDSELEIEFGKFKISYISEQPFEDYVIRTFEVNNTHTAEAREIYHFHYTNWPDFGEPHAENFLKFLFACYDYKIFDSDENNGPAVIHCSAGVGRSGTLALVDSTLQLYRIYNDKMPLRVIDVLFELRKCRVGLVQTQQQLQFAYEAIISGIKQIEQMDLNEEKEFCLLTTKQISAYIEESSSDDDDSYKALEKKRKQKRKLQEEQRALEQQKKRQFADINKSDSDDASGEDDSNETTAFAKNRVSTVIVNKPRPKINPTETSKVQEYTQKEPSKSIESIEKNTRIAKKVAEIKEKQREHESSTKNGFLSNYKVFIIGGALLLSGLIMTKLYKNYLIQNSSD